VSTLDTGNGMAVVFLGVAAADGKHQCRPATEEEMQRPESDEIKRIYDAGITKEQMSAKHWQFKCHEILGPVHTTSTLGELVEAYLF
jgi:hypothetical protein